MTPDSRTRRFEDRIIPPAPGAGQLTEHEEILRLLEATGRDGWAYLVHDEAINELYPDDGNA